LDGDNIIVTRFILKQIDVARMDNGECRFIVSLTFKESIFTGEAVSPDIEESRLWAVAQATLESICKLLPKSVRMRLDQAGNLTFSSKSMVFVVVEVVEDLSLQFLSGTCLASTPTPDAAAKAILDAVNRRIEKYLPA
jgi:hypothetical protein